MKKRKRKQSNKPLIALLLALIIAMLILVCVCIAMLRNTSTNSSNNKHTDDVKNEEQSSSNEPLSSEENSSEIESESESETKVKAPSNGHTVCIDPGHGGYDRGSEALGYEEAKQVYALGLLVCEELENRGYTVVMTRTDDDTKVTLDERVAISNNSPAEIMVSIHRNKYEASEEVSGMEAWIGSSDPADAHALAESILNKLVATNTMRNRGLKTGSEGSPNSDYAINRGCNVASVILELGFISNKQDNEYYENNIEEYAIAIVDGIDEYFTTYNVGQ